MSGQAVAAAAGANPWTTGLMAVSSLAQLARPAAPAGPSISGQISQMFDNSGWTVGTGKSSASASSSRSADGGMLPTLGIGKDAQLLLIVAVGVILWRKLGK